jgi:hypothetical protein
MTPAICYQCLERIRDLLPVDSVACLDALAWHLDGSVSLEDLQKAHRVSWESAQDPRTEGAAWFRGHTYLAASAVAYGISYAIDCHPRDARIALLDARGARARSICGDASESGWALDAYMIERNRERDAQVAVLRRVNGAA